MRMRISIYLFGTDERLGEAKCHSQHINVLPLTLAEIHALNHKKTPHTA